MMMMIKRRRWQWWSWQFDLVAMEIACKIGIRVFDQNTRFSRSPNLKQDICSLRNHATLSIRFYKKTIRAYALFKRTCPQRSQSSVQPPASSSGIRQQDQRMSLKFVIICSSMQNSTKRTMHVLSLTIVRLKETQLTVTFIPPQVGGASDLVLRNLWSRAFYPKKYNWHNLCCWESQWEQLIVVDYLWGHGGNHDR